MNNKFIKILLSIALLSTMCACKKKDVNSRRSTDTKFDIVDFLKFSTFGENGDGYVEIKTKDISLNDFENEEEYIEIRKDLDELNLYYVTGGSYNGIKASQTSNISNGDVITFSFNKSEDENLSTDKYAYTVEGLGELEEIDLYDENVISFFKANDSIQMNYKGLQNEKLNELSKNLKYTYSTTFSDIELNKTIVDSEVSITDDYARSIGVSSLKEYLARNGYKATYSINEVIKKESESINWSTCDSESLRQEIENKLKAKLSDTANSITVQSVRQTVNVGTAQDDYAYTIFYSMMNGALETSYYKMNAWLGMVDNEYICIFSENSTALTTSETSAYDDTQTLEMCRW